MYKQFCIVGFTAILVACSFFAPSYQKPNLDIPHNWSAATTPANAANLPYLAWWQKFHDPILNQYIESGLQNNATIQIAKAHLEASQAQLLTVKLNWLPFLNVFGGYANGSSQNNVLPIGNLGVVNSSGSFFALLPTYTLNLFTNYTLQKQATYNVEAANNAELSTRLAVIGQITAAYFTNLAQIQLVEQYIQLNNDLTHITNITKALNSRGLGTGISVNEVTNKQQIVAGQLAIVNKNLLATQNALKYLIGQPPGNVVVTNKFSHINPLQIIPGNLPVSVIAARPDILKAEAELKAANEGISVAASALLPSVNLNYFYAQGSGTQTITTPTTGINNSNQQNYYAAYTNWTIAPSAFGEINANSALFKAALANYKFVVNHALHEVDNALANNNSYNQKMSSDSIAYQNLETAYLTKNALYNRGLTTQLLLLGAKVEKDVMAIDVTQTKLQQLVSLVTVYQSLGGGYQYNESATKPNNNKHK